MEVLITVVLAVQEIELAPTDALDTMLLLSLGFARSAEGYLFPVSGKHTGSTEPFEYSTTNIQVPLARWAPRVRSQASRRCCRYGRRRSYPQYRVLCQHSTPSLSCDCLRLQCTRAGAGVAAAARRVDRAATGRGPRRWNAAWCGAEACRTFQLRGCLTPPGSCVIIKAEQILSNWQLPTQWQLH